MSDMSDLPQGPLMTTKGEPRKISANRYQTCPCGVRIYEGEVAFAEWCYVENCPCTPNRWPSGWMINRHGIDEKILQRPGWEPGSGQQQRVKRKEVA